MAAMLVLLIVILAAILIVLLAVLIGSRKPRQDWTALEPVTRLVTDFQRELTELRSTLNNQMLQLSHQMNAQLQRHSDFLKGTHEDYRSTMGQVQNHLGRLQEATRSMEVIGRDIASLQDILRAPKLRGGIGELFLAELLRQILPADHFILQHQFQDGTKVDAVILLGDGMIPVDAKFPLESFKRMLEADSDAARAQAKKEFTQTVKHRIDEIAEKYIHPDEGTYDFALMYIPAENVYYEIIIKDDTQAENLATYAMERRVVPVSPNSFYAYLQAIVRGLKGLRIERSAQRILESMGQLEHDLKQIVEEFETVGRHITNARSSYEKVFRRLDRLKMRFDVLETGPSKPVESQPLEELS